MIEKSITVEGVTFTGYKTYLYKNHKNEPVALTAKYVDSNGNKTFRQYHYTEDGNIAPGGPKGAKIAYRPKLFKAGLPVYVVEGEKCADLMAKLGFNVFSIMGGSQALVNDKAKIDKRTIGKVGELIILPDNDEPSEKWAETIVKRFPDITVKIVNPIIFGGEKDDVFDLVERLYLYETGETMTEKTELGQAFIQTARAKLSAAFQANVIACYMQKIRFNPPYYMEVKEPILWEQSIFHPASKIGQYTNALALKYRGIVEVAFFDLMLVSHLAAILQNRCFIKPKKNEQGWLEPVCMYNLLMAPPGFKKSMVFRAINKPFAELFKEVEENLEDYIEKERGNYEKARTLKKSAEDGLKAATKKVDQLKVKGVLTDTQKDTLCENEKLAKNYEKQLKENAEKLRHPPMDHYTFNIDNITPEAVPGFFYNAKGSLCSLQSEMGLLASVANSFGNNHANLDWLLKAYDNETVTKQRTDSMNSYEIKNCRLSIGLMGQPSLIGDIKEHPASNRGFIERVTFLIKNKLNYEEIDDLDEIPDEIFDGYAEKIRELGEIYYNEKMVINRAYAQPVTFFFDEKAQVFYNEVENYYNEKRKKADDPVLQSYFGKQAAKIARLAVILHVGNGRNGNEIGKPDLETAFFVNSEYLEEHTEYFVKSHTMDKETKRLIRSIIAFFKDNEMGSKAEIAANCKVVKGNKTLKHCLEHLNDLGMIGHYTKNRVDLYLKNPLVDLVKFSKSFNGV